MWKNLRNPLEKLLELRNEFSKVARHKINIQKAGMFINTSNEYSENEIEKIISLKVA